MGDFLDHMFGTTCCAPDGLLTNGNPVSNMVNTILDGPLDILGHDEVGDLSERPMTLVDEPLSSDISQQNNSLYPVTDNMFAQPQTEIERLQMEKLYTAWNDSSISDTHNDEFDSGYDQTEMNHQNFQQLTPIQQMSNLQSEIDSWIHPRFGIQLAGPKHIDNSYQPYPSHATSSTDIPAALRQRMESAYREASANFRKIEDDEAESLFRGETELEYQNRLEGNTLQREDFAFREATSNSQQFENDEAESLFRGETELEYQKRLAQNVKDVQYDHHHQELWARTSNNFISDLSSLQNNDILLNIDGNYDANFSVPYVFSLNNPILQQVELTHGLFKHPWSLLSEKDLFDLNKNLANTFDELFKNGIKYFHQGYIENAIHHFEAALQVCNKQAEITQRLKEEEEVEDQALVGSSEVWRMLGLCHAEHDEDRLAIDCLERAIAQDPYNLEALLNIGVSYVNELDSVRAVKNLRAWISHNPKYHGLEVDLNDGYSDGSEMDEVMQLMLLASTEVNNDPDVQVVLGVLYNVTQHFDLASEAFASAAQVRSADYSIWNKLGATNANANKSEAALYAYHKALNIKPRYARGWLNLGIAHANLGELSNAISCYLSALELNSSAKHIWNYTRMALSELERYDLIPLAAKNDINNLRKEFPEPPHGNPCEMIRVKTTPIFTTKENVDGTAD